MAIVENIASEVGDVIVIKSETPIVGIVVLSSFIDTTLNEAVDKFFTKTFRYSLDGINYTPWTPLTNSNISSIPIQITDTFLIEYRYRRDGSDVSQPGLGFNEVQLDGNYTEIPCGDSYSNSIFSTFFSCTDACVLSWMINVLEKLYRQGILPEYIERGEQNNDSRQDTDFLEFWKSITQYFALVVCYAREWELSSATGNYDILLEYLQNQTFLFCGDEPVEDLAYIMNNTYDEARHRGTLEIIKTKEDQRKIDGEWHRLYCHLDKCSDWYFSNTFNYNIGWVGDKASPLYKGTYLEDTLIKAYETTEGVKDLSKYPLLNQQNISLQQDTDNNGITIDIMKISGVSLGQESGIGHINGAQDVKKLIKISTKCSYEITFWIKTEIGGRLTFKLDTYDKSGVQILGGLESAYWEVTSDTFVEKEEMGLSSKWYFIRGIVYSSQTRRRSTDLFTNYLLQGITPPITQAHLSFLGSDIDLRNSLSVINAQDGQLRFKKGISSCYISPKIVLDNKVGGVVVNSLKLFDIKVRPVDTYYSTGFQQCIGFIKAKVENFSQVYTNKETEGFVREFLLPYRSTFKTTFLNPSEDTTVDSIVGIIDQSSVYWTDPVGSKVREDDRYLVVTSLGLKLYQYNSGWILSGDNSTGSKAYIESNRSVFSYNNNKWNFSSN